MTRRGEDTSRKNKKGHSRADSTPEAEVKPSKRTLSLKGGKQRISNSGAKESSGSTRMPDFSDFQNLIEDDDITEEEGTIMC